MDLTKLELNAATCTACELHKGRINPVFAKGNSKSKILVCGMVPAKDENEAGSPFVGRAGKLLDVILGKAGLSYNEVYITNLVKCFLAAGKPLKQEWVDYCLPYLILQIKAINPDFIVALGIDATAALLGEDPKKIKKPQGVIYDFASGIKLMSTYHPSYLLRTGGEKSIKFNDVVDHVTKVRNMCYY